MLWLLPLLFAGAPVKTPPPPAPPDWQATLERVVPAVVSIRVNRPRAFDTENAGNTIATGFVVDVERGLIVSNRHVPGPGPFLAEAIFQDNEEVPLTLAYRDPIHDFSILRFDPKAVRYMTLSALPLYPEGATVGTEIRVVGNDAGQKLSFHAGTIARLDREAPDYGKGNYNDYNIFYIQAASGTTGGSSGSPVIDASGRAIALNAGGMKTSAAAYYLPLPRIIQALDAVRQGLPVARGTLQTSFIQEPYDEARRLGLPDDIEKELRGAFPGVLGVLVTRGVLIGGPGDGKLRTGDLVVGVEGKPLEGHVALEAALDSHVGRTLKLRIVRGGEVMEVEVTPGDLHAVTPSDYVEVGGALLHPLSLQQARNYGIATKGIYIANPGYLFGPAGLGRGAVLTEIDGQAVNSMDELQAELLKHPDGDRFSIRYFNLPDPRDYRVAFTTMDRRWFDARRCTSANWVWSCVELPPATGPAADRESQTVSFPKMGSALLQKLAPSLVYLRFTAPFRPDGLYAGALRGTGIVVDAKRGWILTDRDTVPIALGDVRITVAGALDIPGQVLWVHPVHNLALVAYDPALLGETPMRAVELDPAPLKPGEELWEVGFSPEQDLVSRQARVSRMTNIDLPLPNPPFFRDSNLQVAVLEGEQAVNGGLLVDRRGRMRALWASFVDLSGEKPSSVMRGIPTANVARALEAVEANAAWPVLGVELQGLSLAEARLRGLSATRAAAIEAHDKEQRQVFVVRRRNLSTPAGQALREGDLLLDAGGQTVTRYSQIEELAWTQAFPATVLRDGKETNLMLAVRMVSGDKRGPYLSWAGAIVQEIPLHVLEQQGVAQQGVYVSFVPAGSPASRHRLSPTWRILEVDGKPISNLEAFQAAVAGKADNSSVRLKTEDLDGLVRVLTIKLDLNFWPTSRYQSENGSWKRVDLE